MYRVQITNEEGVEIPNEEPHAIQRPDGSVVGWAVNIHEASAITLELNRLWRQG